MWTEYRGDVDDRAAALWADEMRAGELSDERRAALEAWLAKRPGRRLLLRQHEMLIADPAVLWAAQRVAREKTVTAPSRRGVRLSWAVASVTMCGVATVLAFGLMSNRGELIVGKRGASEPVALADGSAVRLNGDSQVRVVLGAQERVLHLEGEGFFEVAPDKARPFSVETEGVRVTAVGTRFNVDTYQSPDGPVVEVVVFEGIVDVTPAKGGLVRVRAGERAQVVKGTVHNAALPQVEAETDIPSWAKGWLELDEASLISVVGDLERATGVRVSLSDPRLGEALVSGRFSYAHPENALAAIARIHGLRLTRKAADRYVLSDG